MICRNGLLSPCRTSSSCIRRAPGQQFVGVGFYKRKCIGIPCRCLCQCELPLILGISVQKCSAIHAGHKSRTSLTYKLLSVFRADGCAIHLCLRRAELTLTGFSPFQRLLRSGVLWDREAVAVKCHPVCRLFSDRLRPSFKNAAEPSISRHPEKLRCHNQNGFLIRFRPTLMRPMDFRRAPAARRKSSLLSGHQSKRAGKFWIAARQINFIISPSLILN
ncbi:hypothetical protein SAMN05216466_13635 [Paraburkholderia phenazinium]|uniref:Uncharacterized protein n=1 Tax=Paraburkholderia phenazinium TaxID=60549 RepID=A0A1G8NQD1_9BURK|nr:hypothetical protein SAMN05216466_13635 [Paraburkholderia phenazinium]